MAYATDELDGHRWAGIYAGRVLSGEKPADLPVQQSTKVLLSLRVRLGTLSGVAELSQHEADGREFQKREGVAVEIFPILRETTAAVEPRNRAFDDPTLG